jgi:hypothetical protein
MAERGSEELNIRLAVGRRGDARSGALGARLSKAIGGQGLGLVFRFGVALALVVGLVRTGASAL